MAAADSSKTGLGIMACLLIGATALFFSFRGEDAPNQAWLDKHQSIYKDLQATLDEFRNAEIAQQNYLGTGNDDYMMQFKSAVARGNEHLFNLRDYYSGNAAYSERFRTLEQRIRAITDQLKLSADVREKKGEKAARDLYLTSRETKETARIWRDLADAQDAEVVLLQNKVKELGAPIGLVRGLFFFFIGLLAFAYWFVTQGRQPALKEVDEKNRVLASELESVKVQLDRLANIDFMTEVLNLRGLEQVLAVEENRTGRVGGQLVAVLINCDNFRRINEALGHAVGDVVLKELSKRISGTLRPSDHVARVGGDEFLIVLPDTQLAYAMRVAERIRTAVSDSPLKNSAEAISITVSIGVATLPPKITSIEEVLSVTRSALKRSKGQGKNRVSLAREGSGEPEGTPAGARDIVEVLCDGTHFRTVFQPIIDLSTEMVSGYEMYSRGPDGAFESPADFFRVCVENNVLTTVDILCLKLCIAATANAGNHLRFHINLFPSTMLDTPIDNLLALFPTDRSNRTFCVEISEQQFVGDPGYLREHVNALKQAGILVAIDDVGFGRSSLESLILLEPDLVKVDRKYVTGVSKEPAKARLLKRVVNVGKSLGAEIVAEGIEDSEDLPILKEIGVHYGQGYFWGGLLEVLPTSTTPKPVFQPEKR